jgi:hypothetical protein
LVSAQPCYTLVFSENSDNYWGPTCPFCHDQNSTKAHLSSRKQNQVCNTRATRDATDFDPTGPPAESSLTRPEFSEGLPSAIGPTHNAPTGLSSRSKQVP